MLKEFEKALEDELQITCKACRKRHPTIELSEEAVLEREATV